uniref:Uncharacterized protein n=1 Tax=Tanacetum cinerariifolium TaxID=118510 RepID=A0A6L2MUT3_TANCI|nr:hypothetical protein [Tanacetum cinerariifolium]
MADVNMMIKRGKIAGKPTSPCNKYEFSYRNTLRHPLALFSSHKKHKNNRHHLGTSNPPLAIDYSDDIVINAAVLRALDILKSATMTSPPLMEFGIPLNEKMMITDSPSLVIKDGEDDHVDEAAEEFIRRPDDKKSTKGYPSSCEVTISLFQAVEGSSSISDRITDSPMPVTNGGEDGQVDEAAEEFIRRFYNDRRREN